MLFGDQFDELQAPGSTMGNVQPSPNAIIHPLATQSKNGLIGALASPFNQMQNNWSTMTGDFSNNKIGSGLFDAYKMVKDPAGTWGGDTPVAHPSGIPDEHLGPADANGNRPIKDSGFKYLKDNMPTGSNIPDNQNMISIAKNGNGMPESKDMSQADPQTGKIGRTIINYI